jgi:hypothetical protein
MWQRGARDSTDDFDAFFPNTVCSGEGWHLVVKGDDEKIRNLMLGLTGLLI